MHETDEATDRNLTEISEHQLKHCEQLTNITDAVNGIAQGLAVLATVLQRKGLVSHADIMAEIEGAEADALTEETKEEWN